MPMIGVQETTYAVRLLQSIAHSATLRESWDAENRDQGCVPDQFGVFFAHVVSLQSKPQLLTNPSVDAGLQP